MSPPPDKRVDVEGEVQAFLDWNAEQARKGYTIANVMAQQGQFMTEVRNLTHGQNARQEQFFSEIRSLVHGQNTQILNINGRVADLESDRDEVHTLLGEHGVALNAIKRRVRQGPQDQEMDTGVHQLAALQQRLAEQERKRSESERVKAEDVVWWKRTVIQVAVAAIGWTVTTALAILVALALAKSATPDPSAKPLPPPPSQH